MAESDKTRDLAERLNPGEGNEKQMIHISRGTAKEASNKLYDTAIKERAQEKADAKKADTPPQTPNGTQD